MQSRIKELEEEAEEEGGRGYLLEGEGLAGVGVQTDVLVGAGAQALLDEAEEVLLVHGGGCVHVGVHLYEGKQ